MPCCFISIIFENGTKERLYEACGQIQECVPTCVDIFCCYFYPINYKLSIVNYQLIYTCPYTEKNTFKTITPNLELT